VDIPLTGLVMPIGISFYTFSQIACLADCYKGIRFGGSLDDGRTKPCSFVEYGAFVSFFPKLIQGPIASHREVVPGFRSRIVKKIDYGNLCRGIYAFALGLAKNSARCFRIKPPSDKFPDTPQSISWHKIKILSQKSLFAGRLKSNNQSPPTAKRTV